MNIIPQYWIFESIVDKNKIVRQIERAGRTCYKSEKETTLLEAEDFCRKLIASGHLSVIEHCYISVRIVTNRGVTHEIVRHRLASYSQESTRYCDYSGEVTFIEPVFEMPESFYNFLKTCEEEYQHLRSQGLSPQKAREVLPNALKTEIVMTCNLREWRHFFTLRTSPAAHPQLRALATDMLAGFMFYLPCIFEDIKFETTRRRSQCTTE